MKWRNQPHEPTKLQKWKIKIQKPLRFNRKSTELGVPRTRARLCMCACVFGNWRMVWPIGYILLLFIRCLRCVCARSYQLCFARRGKGVFSRVEPFLSPFTCCCLLFFLFFFLGFRSVRLFMHQKQSHNRTVSRRKLWNKMHEIRAHSQRQAAGTGQWNWKKIWTDKWKMRFNQTNYNKYD